MKSYNPVSYIFFNKMESYNSVSYIFFNKVGSYNPVSYTFFNKIGSYSSVSYIFFNKIGSYSYIRSSCRKNYLSWQKNEALLGLLCRYFKKWLYFSYAQQHFNKFKLRPLRKFCLQKGAALCGNFVLQDFVNTFDKKERSKDFEVLHLHFP